MYFSVCAVHFSTTYTLRCKKIRKNVNSDNNFFSSTKMSSRTSVDVMISTQSKVLGGKQKVSTY